jgi:hypothetical protein
MNKLLLVFSLTISIATGQAYSQDLIYLKNDTVEAKVLEIGTRRIKYQEKDLPVRELRKHDVLRLEYSNGATEDFGSMNPRKIRPLNIGLVFSNYPPEDIYLAEFELCYFLKPYLAVSLNTGISTNGNAFVTAGPRYYINKIHSDHKIVPYIGFQIGVGFIDDQGQAFFAIQWPFGIDYITKKGYNFALEYSPRSIINYDGGPSCTIGIKIGKNF